MAWPKLLIARWQHAVHYSSTAHYPSPLKLSIKKIIKNIFQKVICFPNNFGKSKFSPEKKTVSQETRNKLFGLSVNKYLFSVLINRMCLMLIINSMC